MSKNKKDNKDRQHKRHYNLEEKKEVLIHLIQNGMDYTQTAKERGITARTLKKWYDYHRALVYQDEKDMQLEIHEQVKATIIQDEGDFLAKVFEVKNKTLDKIKERIEYETNLDKLINALDILQNLTSSAKEGEATNSLKIGVLQKIENQLIVKN